MESVSNNTIVERRLFYIQLFDRNCPSCCSGVTNVYVDDIDEFAEMYSQTEADKNRVDRLMRSKSGEIITDYYSDDPALNIVQSISVEDYGIKVVQRSECAVSLENGYGWDSEYYFRELVFEIRYIKWNGKYYKLMNPHAKGCCRKTLSDIENMWHKITIQGNKFWLYGESEDIPYESLPIDAFKDVTLDSFVWHMADQFETEQEMLTDKALPWPTTDQIIRAMADLPGDAG